MRFIDPPLVPKSVGTLQVLMICRVSSPGKGKQREESNEDQEVRLREYLSQIWDGPVEIRVIAGTGSGENTQRQELLEAELAVETGEFDLVLCEDLSRISRRYHAQRFCELAEDYDTRMIAVNGDVDTAQANWRMSAGFSAMRHELYNADTSRRIQRSHQNLFDQGGMCQHLIYGYVREPGTKNDEAISKDPQAEPIYREWFAKLKNGASFAEVADWLNDRQVPLGPLCRSRQWTGSMVGRITRNPLLKGVRERNRKVSRRINKTGKYRSVAAPPDMLRQRACPHLAFVEADLFDEVNEKLKVQNVNYRRAKEGFSDPRKGVPKKRTQWPAQHLSCGVCGRPMICQGKKERRMLMCSGAANYQCWNSVALNLEIAGEKLAAAFHDAIAELPDYDDALIEAVAEEADRLLAGRDEQRQQLVDQIDEVERQLNNLSETVAQSGGSTTLLERLNDCESQKQRFQRELKQLERQVQPQLVLPSLEELKNRAKDSLLELRRNCAEFARLMAQLVPSLYVFPFSLLDGGKTVLRATVDFDFGALVPEAEGLKAIGSHFSGKLVVDLFDPPQPEQHRQQIWELLERNKKLKERDIAAQVGVTHPVVQRAKKLQRQMIAAGLADGYRPVNEPPAEGRLRRHKHKRYRFEPLAGFPLKWPHN